VTSVADEWDELATRTQADPFRRPGWVDAWHRAFGRGELDVLTVRDGDRLVGVLPVDRGAAGLRSPTNWHTPVFGATSESTEAIAEITQALFSNRPHWISVSFLDQDDPMSRALRRHARSSGYRTLERTVQRSPYMDLEGDWEERWHGLGSKRRNTLKRRRRRLEERGEVTLGITEGGEELEGLLEEALQVEALGWKGERRSAIISRRETHQFYRSVAAWAAGRGIYRLALLRVNGRLVAFDYALEEDDHYLLKTGFDPDYSDCAPGLVLRMMMIERAYSLDLRRYEFLGGEDPYKLDWTDTAHDRALVQAFRPSPAGLALWAAFRYGRPLAKRALGTLRR
jgi:CelD/BcsL family acetyltransferase involved in cellulose biosynthesis